MNWNGNGIGLRIWATLVGLAAIGGCQNNAPNVADHTPRAEQVEADKTVTVGVEDPANEISPAALPPQELAEASTPEEVCQILHHALDAEDRIGWQKCLSKSATRQIHLADLELMLPASSESAVSIGSTQYATSKRKVAFVPLLCARIGGWQNGKVPVLLAIEKRSRWLESHGHAVGPRLRWLAGLA